MITMLLRVDFHDAVLHICAARHIYMRRAALRFYATDTRV